MTSLKRWTIAAVSVTGVALVIAAYYFLDPLESRLMPKCMFHYFTGLNCPGCGSQRALHSLLHGDISGAWHYNALLLIMIPWLACLAIAETLRKRRPALYARVNSRMIVIPLAVVIIGWGVVRNLIGS